MSEAIVEKESCKECGAEVRDNTVFCYNCGSRVVNEDADKAASIPPDMNGVETTESDAAKQAALADLEKRFRIDEEEDDRLAKAAAERRKARVTNRKITQFVWQPRQDANLWFLILTVVIVSLSAIAVLLMAFWK